MRLGIDKASEALLKIMIGAQSIHLTQFVFHAEKHPYIFFMELVLLVKCTVVSDYAYDYPGFC